MSIRLNPARRLKETLVSAWAVGVDLSLWHCLYRFISRRLFRVTCLLLLIGHATSAAPALGQVPRLTPRSSTEALLSFSAVVKKVSPAVVNIITSTRRSDQRNTALLNDPIFRHFERLFGNFDNSIPRERRGLGSGVVVSDTGIIITNAHVVSGSEQILVGFTDGREFSADVLLSDTELDIAVLKTNADIGDRFDYLEIGRQRVDVEIGDLVLAIGNPYGIGQSVTSGIVSAVGRRSKETKIPTLFIQTDASINPGNSGGALVNSSGDLLGINTAIVSPSGGSAGIGFAIPSSVASLVVDAALRGDKRLVRPWSGVTAQVLTDDLVDALNLESKRGALIRRIHPDSSMWREGLRTGDVIVSVDGEVVDAPDTFEYLYSTGRINTRMQLGYIRNGVSKKVRVRLLPAPNSLNESVIIAERGMLFGAEIASLSESRVTELNLPRQYGEMNGVVVLSGGNSSGLKLRRGDVIMTINGIIISDVESVIRVIKLGRLREIELMRMNRRMRFKVR